MNYHLKINFYFLYLWFFFWTKGKPLRSVNFFPSVNQSTKFLPVAWKCLQILVWRTSITCRVYSGGLWVNVGTLPPSPKPVWQWLWWSIPKIPEVLQSILQTCTLGSLLSENEMSLSCKRSMQVNKSIYKVSWMSESVTPPFRYPLPPPLKKIRN